MVFFFAQTYVALAAVAWLFGSSSAAPTNATELVQRKTAAVQNAPHWVVYTDDWINGENGPPDASLLKGYNTYIMGFWLTNRVADQASEWTLISAEQRASVKAAYAAAGIKIMVSAFGQTDHPTTDGADPTTTANNLAAWVKQYGLDGVDVDYEDIDAFNNNNAAAVTWLTTFTKQLRTQLPASQYILTHAPVAPWLTKGYRGGGYQAVHSAVGSMIDWYNIQFYNQGASEYTDCTGLLTTSGGQYPGSSLFEISAAGIELDKLVIGKPATAARAPSGGYMAPSTLATCVATAASKGWNGGVMVWEYPDATANWIQTVRGSTFPISGGGSTPTSTTKVTTPTSTTPPAQSSAPASGSCAGVPAWSSSVAYVGGSEVTYNGELWKANWWTEADVPGGAAGSWALVGKC